MEFQGHLVGEGIMTIPEHRITALQTCTTPVTKKGLRSFLEAIGFYRRYVELLGIHAAVLSPSSAKLSPSKVSWSEEMESAFIQIRECLANACKLTIHLPEDVMSVVTDASGLGVGGVLQVKRNGQWEAAAFYSRQIRGAEQQ